MTSCDTGDKKTLFHNYDSLVGKFCLVLLSINKKYINLNSAFPSISF